MSDVTRILTAIEKGDHGATDELLTVVYAELRSLAARLLSRESPGQTLQGTALVHEAYLRLVGSAAQSWSSRRHFFLAAAEAMRRILVENARRKKRLKHGGDRRRIDIDLAAAALVAHGDTDGLIDLDEALTHLSDKHEAKADLVKLRFFAGLTAGEAAEALGISPTTAKRHWRYARAWLYREISKGDAQPRG